MMTPVLQQHLQTPLGLLRHTTLRVLGVIGICCLTVIGCDNNSSPATRALQTTRCITDIAAAPRHEFLCDGVQFKVLLTQACIDSACGLIVDVHGWLSNPDEQERRSNLVQAAQARGGYIIIQPGELSQPSSWNANIHYDIVFDFMQQAMRAFDVDRNRVHFTGFSQGGQMTWKFVCDHSDIIASAAPLAAPEVYCFLNGTGPARQVPLFFISGTNDVLVRYYSAATPISAAATLLSVMYDYGMVDVDTRDYTFSATGDLKVDETGVINTLTAGTRFDILDGGAQTSYLWTRYTNADGIAFEHLRHTNGHVYPDNPDSLIFPEDPAVWFSVGEAILQFFIDNPRR